MKILFCGDVVGRSGRDVIEHNIPVLRKQFDLDMVIVNGENSAAGFGITQDICEIFFNSKVDIITLGNHSWDQKETARFIQNEHRLIRPYNYSYPNMPGNAIGCHVLPTQQKVIVMTLLGRLFMKDDTCNPFYAVDQALQPYSLTDPTIAAIIVEIHAEATSEKVAMAQYLNGRVSMVVGTHTHIPTADTRILSKGTAYQTDLGMCGDYDSVIGMETQTVLERFLGKTNPPRMQPAQGEATLAGVIVTVDPKTGVATHIQRLLLGPLINSNAF